MRGRTNRKAGAGRKKSGRIRGRAKLTAIGAAIFLTGAMIPEISADAAAENGQPQTVFVQMPGFVVEQWGAPRLMTVTQDAAVTALADTASEQIGNVTAGQTVYAWGQTDTGWYFVQCKDALGYVRYEAAAFISEEEQKRLAAEAQKAAEEAARAAQQKAAEEARLAQLAAQRAQIEAAAANQPAVAAGIVFIGDSRMVTLKESVEKELGVCPAAVIAKNGSRYEWFHDTAVPQADKIIGNGSRVVINMGVNDLNDADKYAQDMNYWGAVWSARGAQVYYASVNPVWANSHGMTQERVKLFNDRLKSQLIPQITWLDSHNYLLGAGVHSYDGIHYKDDTNLVLYQYYMTMIGAV